jgi:hypothetical protein
MKRSLAVERAQMLEMITHLESVVGRLQDVDAGVSKYADELRRLRIAVMGAQSPKRWDHVVEVGCDLLVRIAVELLKAWL